MLKAFFLLKANSIFLYSYYFLHYNIIIPILHEFNKHLTEFRLRSLSSYIQSDIFVLLLKIEFAFNGKNALSLKIIVREEDVFMLKTWIPEEIPEKEELKKRIKEAGEKLYQQKMKLKEHKLPVLVLFEGWGASGKGTTIGRVIKYIDPRFFKVATMSKPTEDELRRPFLYRYFNQIPDAED